MVILSCRFFALADIFVIATLSRPGSDTDESHSLAAVPAEGEQGEAG